MILLCKYEVMTRKGIHTGEDTELCTEGAAGVGGFF